MPYAVSGLCWDTLLSLIPRLLARLISSQSFIRRQQRVAESAGVTIRILTWPGEPRGGQENSKRL